MLNQETLTALQKIVKAHKNDDIVYIADEGFDDLRELVSSDVFKNGEVPKLILKCAQDAIVDGVEPVKYLKVLLERQDSWWFIIFTLIKAALKLKGFTK